MISQEQARQIVLRAQGLLEPDPFGRGIDATLKAIEHLGYVQIDTIAVIERAHHHVLWNRVSDYQPAHLAQLQSGDKTIFEYWSHAASYLPMRDYRYSLPRKAAFAAGKKHWFERDLKAMKSVLERIRADGPLRAKDFEAPAKKKSGPWFEWNPAKKALEQLFIEGKLMVRERKGFQKVYDLTERVLPADVDTRVPTPKEFAKFKIRQFLRAQGLGLESEMRYLQNGLQSNLMSALLEMLKTGEVAPINVDGIADETYFVLPDSVTDLEPEAAFKSAPLQILSPFDNLVIQRARLKRLFNFDYQIECYVPEANRKFGYFSLPLLWKGALVGRLDAKAERQEQRLVVHKLFLEQTFKREAELRPKLKKQLKAFAAFNGCKEVITKRQ